MLTRKLIIGKDQVRRAWLCCQRQYARRSRADEAAAVDGVFEVEAGVVENFEVPAFEAPASTKRLRSRALQHFWQASNVDAVRRRRSV
jgi:hypothetical protein